MSKELRRPFVSTLHWLSVAVVGMMLIACTVGKDRPRATYLPISEIEAAFGPLVTAGNHPTPEQSGTGDRLGLFRDSSGTIWGFPLSISTDGTVVGCAPPTLHDAAVTDRYPSGTTVIGATNEPTGWRGGTGKLELLLRDVQGRVQWRAVNGAQLVKGPVCWAQEPPGPKHLLFYYRVVPGTR
jgi:hypothetical protein